MAQGWINVSNDKILADHDITCGRPKIERGIAVLSERAIEDLKATGLDEDDAKERVEVGMFRRGLNRARKEVWQIHESMIPALREWVEEEHKWISANNYDRLKSLDITTSPEKLTAFFQEVYNEELGARLGAGLSIEEAKRAVTSSFVRESASEQGRPLWQIHESALDLVREKIGTPEWINSHARESLRPYGITCFTQNALPILQQHYDYLISKVASQQQMTTQQAAIVVNGEKMKPAKSRYGFDSFDIHASYIPELIKECPRLCSRKGGEWLSNTSLRLHDHGIRGNGETVERAMRTLRDKLSLELTKTESINLGIAMDKVEAEMVGPHVGLGGKTVWKIHESCLNALREVFEHMPHFQNYENRRAKSSSEGRE